MFRNAKDPEHTFKSSNLVFQTQEDKLLSLATNVSI